jgi:hypothetical protein
LKEQFGWSGVGGKSVTLIKNRCKGRERNRGSNLLAVALGEVDDEAPRRRQRDERSRARVPQLLVDLRAPAAPLSPGPGGARPRRLHPRLPRSPGQPHRPRTTSSSPGATVAAREASPDARRRRDDEEQLPKKRKQRPGSRKERRNKIALATQCRFVHVAAAELSCSLPAPTGYRTVNPLVNCRSLAALGLISALINQHPSGSTHSTSVCLCACVPFFLLIPSSFFLTEKKAWSDENFSENRVLFWSE